MPEPTADGLYGLPPGEFVTACNRLARALSQAGERAAAARVKALRRPSLPVWAVNQLVSPTRPVLRRELGDGQAPGRAGAWRDA